MFKNNIIDLKRHFKAKQKSNKKRIRENVPGASVLDMIERREAVLQDERREVRRTILTGFIGAFVVIPVRADATGGLMKVDIYDISENGIAFDMESKDGHFSKGEDVAMRVYLSQEIYFPFVVKIQNFRELNGEAITRHGANFVRGTVNDQALHHFVKFIETVSANLVRDTGDVMVSGLKK
jgi:hypothetical protein